MKAQSSNSERQPAQVRDYRGDDFPAIVALDGICFEPGIAYTEQEMKRFISLPTRIALVAQSEDEIAGFCIGYRSPSRRGRILTLDVRESKRRLGIGERLLQEVTARLVAAGATETVLEVDVRNEPALRFYERLGFCRRRSISDYYGPNRDAFEMIRGEPSIEG